MNYLTVENIEKSFGDKTLFSNIVFGIQQGEKLALIGKNGSGKSTLLDIVAGELPADKGKVIFNNDIKFSYLPQQIDIDPQLSIIDYMLSSDNEFVQAIRDYEKIMQIANNEQSEAVQQKLQKASNKMDALGAWNYEAKIKEALGRLQITDFYKKVGELSGGQKRKLALARTLVEDVDLMIMDEPTNHLDVDMIEWIEEKLDRNNLSLLIVSHDRYFLDNVCNSFMELEGDKVRQFKGDYRFYLEKKAEIEAIENVKVAKARNLYSKELDWMRRSPKARTHKSKKREEGFYEIEKKSQKIIKEELPDFEMKMSRIGNKILEINNIHKSFDGKTLINNFSHTFKKGERVGVVGPNGSGKSTFLKLIMGELKPDKGKITAGKTVVFGYFSQDGPEINGNERLINIVKEVAEEIPYGSSSTMSASQFLRHFGFDDTTQYNYYSNLSGGEKRRLHLILNLVKNPNFLIMDEPTNDLDIETISVLEDFLARYNGCLLVATHDRAFLDKITDHIFVFGQGDKIVDFPFSYTEYREKMKKEVRQKKRSAKEKDKTEESRKPKSNKKPSYKFVREFELISQEIENLEKQKKEISELLNGVETDHSKLLELTREFEKLSEQLEEKEMRWLELSEMMN
jgi:ATP-binding cassette subfamily F protein uup